MKLLDERHLEYSICAMFLSSSLIVLIKAIFLSKILLAMLIRGFLIFGVLFGVIVFNTSTLIDFFEQFVGFEFGTRSTGWIHQSAIVGMSNLFGCDACSRIGTLFRLASCVGLQSFDPWPKTDT